MTFVQKDMSGSLRENDRKEKDSHPDYRGDATINGVQVWLSGWLKQDRNGNTYMSLSFKPKDAGPKVPRYPDDRITTGPQRGDDSDIPF